MAFEFLKVSLLECFLDDRVFGVGKHNITPAFQLPGSFQGRKFHLSADILCSLPPLGFDDLDAQFFHGIFGDAQPAIFHVVLNDDPALPVIPLLEDFYPSLHLRRFDHLPVPEFRLRVHAADIFTDDDQGTGNGGGDGHGFPMNAGNIRGSQGPA